MFYLFLACNIEAETTADSTYLDTATLVHCEEPSYQEWTEGFLMGKCQSCHAVHSPNRYGAPENVFFDSEEASIYWLSSIERTVLNAETMPPSGGVTEEEKELLRRWIECDK